MAENNKKKKKKRPRLSDSKTRMPLIGTEGQPISQGRGTTRMPGMGPATHGEIGVPRKGTHYPGLAEQTARGLGTTRPEGMGRMDRESLPNTGAVPPSYDRSQLPPPRVGTQGQPINVGRGTTQVYGPIDRHDPQAIAAAKAGMKPMGLIPAIGGRMVQAGDAVANAALVARENAQRKMGQLKDWIDPTPTRSPARSDRPTRRAAQDAAVAPPPPPPSTTREERAAGRDRADAASRKARSPVQRPDGPPKEPTQSTREDKPKGRPRKSEKAPEAKAPKAKAPPVEAPSAGPNLPPRGQMDGGVADIGGQLEVRSIDGDRSRRDSFIARHGIDDDQLERDRVNRIRSSRGMPSIEETQAQHQQRISDREDHARSRQLADREGRYTTTGKPSTSIRRIYQHEAPEQYRQAVSDRRARDAGMAPGQLDQQEAATDLARAQAEAVRGGVGSQERLQQMRETGQTGRANIAADTARAQMDSALENAAMQVGSTEKMHLIDAQQKYDVDQQSYELALGKLKSDSTLENAKITLANRQADNDARISAVSQMMSMMTSTPAEKLAFAAAAASGGLMGDEIIEILFSTEMTDPAMKQAAMFKIMKLLGIEIPSQTGPANAADASRQDAMLGL